MRAYQTGSGQYKMGGREIAATNFAKASGESEYCARLGHGVGARMFSAPSAADDS
jgi:hypothetical protein